MGTESHNGKIPADERPKGKHSSAVAESKGRPAFRMAVPEYYAASCLSCHGGPKGDIDVTGYPKKEEARATSAE